jgi:protein O-GlcNAc transferase
MGHGAHPPPPRLERVLWLRENGRVREALKVCSTLLRRDQRNAEALHTSGVLAAELGNWRRASYFFTKAAFGPAVEPRYFTSLAASLWCLRRGVEAAAAAAEGLRAFPRDKDLLIHHAKLLADINDVRALPALKRAIPLAPDPSSLLERAATIAENAGNLTASAAFWHRFLELVPRDFGALNNLARVRSAQGRIAEAVALYRRALRLQGTPEVVGSNLLLTLLYDAGATPRKIFAEHRAWAARVGEPSVRSHQAPAVRRSKLRVGYVSGDFRMHAVAYFAEPVLKNHNPDRIEVHCFSNLAEHDRVTARFRQYAAGWHQIDQLNDDDAAECIRRAGIDILIDMSGHSCNNRLPLFARRPAAIQANYLGYQATSGLRALDYRFTDSIADPPGKTERLHSETLVRLDPCYQCYRPLLARMPVDPPPCETRGFVTLACFAIRQKLSPPLLEAWAGILKQSPSTRLLLKCYSLSDRDVRHELVAFFDRRGISPRRLDLISWTPTMRDHLRSYARADLMLDTYPYNSATMTCEAMWRGVPTVTWAGSTFVSRMGATLLTQVGLQNLIANSAADYVEKALAAIRDAPWLAERRRSLRGQMRNSPLMESIRLTRQMEDAYFRMWRA